MPSGKASAFLFDEFRLDCLLCVLHRPDGTQITLRPKAFGLFCYLLERPGVLHARETLLDALWPGVAVTDDSLTQCIGDLRRALGGRATAVLRTLPRRGYILAVPVRREVVPAGRAGPEPARTELGPGTPPMDGDLLVFEAITPVSEDAEARRVAQALNGEMLKAFSQSELIQVQTRVTLPLPAESYRLSGALLPAGEEPLLSLVLEEGGNGRIMWADQMRLPPEGKRESALAVLMARVERLVVADALARAHQKPPEALRAYDFIRLGCVQYGRGGQNDAQEAEQSFQRAIAMNPNIASAHAYLATIQTWRATHRWSTQDETAALEQALVHARRAVEMKPRSALCQGALAYVLALCRQWDAALETARVAVRLSTMSALGSLTLAAVALLVSGEAEEAVEALRAPIALDPFSPAGPRTVLGTALVVAGRPEEALTELRRAAVHLPGFPPCLRAIVLAACESGQMEEARRAADTLRQIRPHWVEDVRGSLSYMRATDVVDRYALAFNRCVSP